MTHVLEFGTFTCVTFFTVSTSQLIITLTPLKQEWITVGCIPPTAVAVMGDWTRSPSTSPLSVVLDQTPLNFPHGCGPGLDPPQLPPWVWAWTRSPSTSPLDVGLDQIPLNFSLGCGPGNPQGMLGTDPPRTTAPPGSGTPLWTDKHL